MKTQRIYTIVILMLCSNRTFAQQEGTFYFMNTISQSAYFNPAFTPKYNTTIGLPGLSSNYLGIFNSGFAYKDLIAKREEDDSLVMTLDKFYSRLKDKNNLKVGTTTDLFHLAFKLNPRMHFVLNVTHKNNVHLVYPKQIANLLINGNVPYVGENTHFSVRANGAGYLESGLGLNYEINRHWTVGTRIKLLKGYANLTTERSEFTINIADNYHMELSGDVLLKTSGVGLMDDEVNNFRDIQKLLSNNGYGMDIGIAYKPIDKLTLGFSVVDFGRIKWTNGIKAYMMDPQNATATFKGFDIAKLIEEGSAYEIDSLEEKFEFQELEVASYASRLPMKLFFSGSYELTRNLYANLLMAAENGSGEFDMYATANITKNVGKAMTISLSYSKAQNTSNIWGAGFSFNLAPIQLYVVGDNLLNAAAIGTLNKELNTYVNGLQYFNLRFGLNFIGGWERSTEKLSDDKIF